LIALEVRRAHSAARNGFLEESRLELAEALAGWSEKYPEVETERQVLTGHTAHLLSSVARHARCLVVGTHGRGGWPDTFLGSTSRALVHRTHCPLVVVPAHYSGHAGTAGR
jgi:nucleotide-binding universal stress UspA family protein